MPVGEPLISSSAAAGAATTSTRARARSIMHTTTPRTKGRSRKIRGQKIRGQKTKAMDADPAPAAGGDDVHRQRNHRADVGDGGGGGHRGAPLRSNAGRLTRK